MTKYSFKLKEKTFDSHTEASLYLIANNIEAIAEVVQIGSPPTKEKDKDQYITTLMDKIELRAEEVADKLQSSDSSWSTQFLISLIAESTRLLAAEIYDLKERK